MKGSQKVINNLNELLVDELAARDQYFIHSRMLHEWGYTALGNHVAHEVEEETQHADALIKRILFLEGTPDMQVSKLNIGKDVEQILKNDLNLEYQVVKNLRSAMKLCEAEHDYVTRDMLLKMLIDTEEDHTHWLEQQLELMAKMGKENYLQSQV